MFLQKIKDFLKISFYKTIYPFNPVKLTLCRFSILCHSITNPQKFLFLGSKRYSRPPSLV
ncbi:hypothetical protein A2Z00_05595 [Candidatus Gottesmanbacteria bacterium RBG_13_45_10]|uniref:Uncharacterized protein n=1 Tax=Candidatus Gottesmanbacteria bacterium RBG_13_45_10 TaxID=1798370 RepID=A0A1F5ZG03_9BACT|nr:MAG: hypothetical protein A2Z00_05595 [Candidatus Gottesmanbacteria bacterium RBG_13_45_10]